MKTTILPFLMLILFSCTSPSKDAQSNKITILTNARIIDGKNDKPIDKGSIIIQHGKIVRIVKSEMKFPKNAHIVDLSGKTIMPTLITAHSHLGLSNGTKIGADQISSENVLRQLKKFRSYGIGAVMSLGTDHDFIYELREKTRNGELNLPLILTAGRGFGMPDGAPPITMGMSKVYRPTTIQEVQTDMDELANHKPNMVKLWVDDFNHTMKSKMSPEMSSAIIQAAHNHGLRVAAHVYYLTDAKNLIKEGADVFGHSIRDQKVDKELISLMKTRHVAYIPTLTLDEAFFVYGDRPQWMSESFFINALDTGMKEWLQSENYRVKESARNDFEIAKQNVDTLHKAGVRIGMGTDSGATLARLQGFAEHRELQLLVSAGLTPMEALQAATRVNADILGISHELGTLEAGKRANILVLNEDPLMDISNTQKINSVWINGVKN